VGKIAAFSGKARVGKSVFANIARERYGAKIVSFAGGLKEEVAEFLAMTEVAFMPRHLYGEQSDKEEVLTMLPEFVGTTHELFPDFDDFIIKYGATHDNGVIEFNSRSLMQYWGTEYRRARNTNYWVDAALAKCADTAGPQLFVIDDCRFKNEAQAIRDVGGVLVRIERPGAPTPSNPDHPSEVDLDDWDDWDIIISNSADIGVYQAMCDQALEAICALDDLERGIEHVQQGPL
jgi:hypothetical protein